MLADLIIQLQNRQDALSLYIFFTTLRNHTERVFTYGHLVLLVHRISIPLLSHLAGEGGGGGGGPPGDFITMKSV